jgi:hypothetical protein
MGPKPIREAFRAKAAQVPGVEVALDHERGQTRLPTMPCVTMALLGFEAIDEQTGPFQTMRWSWNVYVYVDFSDAAKAQDELELILPGLARITREDWTLDNTCSKAALLESLDIPELDDAQRWLRKRLQLTAELEEV